MALPHTRITIKEVAKAAAVSVATVSYALRDHPSISPPTRARIKQVAAELGYRRNPVFVTLGTHSQKRHSHWDGLPIAYIWQRTDTRITFVFDHVLAGMRAAATRLGFKIESHCLDDFPTLDSFMKVIRARGLLGVVVGHLRTPEILRHDGFRRVAMVAERQFHMGLPIHTVRASRYMESRVILRRVFGAGYRKVLCLPFWHPSRDVEEDYARYAGLHATAAEFAFAGFPAVRFAEQPMNWNSSKPAEWDIPALRRLMERHRPDAVIAFTTVARFRLADAGFPKVADLGFAAHQVDGERFAGVPVSGCTGGEGQIGEAAIEWLDQLIRLGQFGVPESPRSQVTEPIWLEGGTLPGPNRQSKKGL